MIPLGVTQTPLRSGEGVGPGNSSPVKIAFLNECAYLRRKPYPGPDISFPSALVMYLSWSRKDCSYQDALAGQRIATTERNSLDIYRIKHIYKCLDEDAKLCQWRKDSVFNKWWLSVQ